MMPHWAWTVPRKVLPRVGGMVGESPALLALIELIQQVGPTRATVVILGESGTGKELIAQAVHDGSPRAKKPYIKVSCAALSETLLESELFGHEKGAFTGAAARRQGRFELADGGTLFLDEIGDISASTQIKLLRVLQEREFERVGGGQTIRVDVRLIAATNRDLGAAVREGRFREDLFYRLNVISLTSPPLREREQDVASLAAHFIARYAKAYGKPATGMTGACLAALRAYRWPGNVRELENAMERAVVLGCGTALAVADLPESVRLQEPRVVQIAAGRASGPRTLREIEREAIVEALRDSGGSLQLAAQSLQISLRKVQYKVKEYKLEKAPQRPGPLKLVSG